MVDPPLIACLELEQAVYGHNLECALNNGIYFTFCHSALLGYKLLDIQTCMHTNLPVSLQY